MSQGLMDKPMDEIHSHFPSPPPADLFDLSHNWRPPCNLPHLPVFTLPPALQVPSTPAAATLLYYSDSTVMSSSLRTSAFVSPSPEIPHELYSEAASCLRPMNKCICQPFPTRYLECYSEGARLTLTQEQVHLSARPPEIPHECYSEASSLSLTQEQVHLSAPTPFYAQLHEHPICLMTPLQELDEHCLKLSVF